MVGPRVADMRAGWTHGSRRHPVAGCGAPLGIPGFAGLGSRIGAFLIDFVAVQAVFLVRTPWWGWCSPSQT